MALRPWRSPTSAWRHARSPVRGRRNHRLRPRQSVDHRRDPGRTTARWPTVPSRSSPGFSGCHRTARTMTTLGRAAPTRRRWPWPRPLRRIRRDRHGRGRVFMAPIPGTSGTARRIPWISYEEDDLRMATSAAKILQLGRGVRPALRDADHVRSLRSATEQAPRSAKPTRKRRRPGWSRRSSPESRTTERGQDHVVGVPDKVGVAADLPHRGRGRHQHRHDRAERLRRRHRPHRHLRSRCPAMTAARDGGRSTARSRTSASTPCCTTTGSARCR